MGIKSDKRKRDKRYVKMENIQVGYSEPFLNWMIKYLRKQWSCNFLIFLFYGSSTFVVI